MDSGVIATAALLGASHAVEPDHLAGIVGVPGGAGGTRGAAVGAWFALGHVVLVVGWVVLGTVVLDGLPEGIGRLGDGILAVVLLATGTLVGRDGVRTYRATTPGRHDHVAPLLARTDGGSDQFLVVGLLGAAFTLSPPLTMLGFLTVVLPRVGPAGVGMAVGTYAIAIVATMTAVGVVGGTAVGSLGGLDRRLAGTGKLGAACVLAGLGIATLV